MANERRVHEALLHVDLRVGRQHGKLRPRQVSASRTRSASASALGRCSSALSSPWFAILAVMNRRYSPGDPAHAAQEREHLRLTKLLVSTSSVIASVMDASAALRCRPSMPAAMTSPKQLDVHLWSEQSTPPELSMSPCSGHARGGFHPPALREPEVATSPNTRRRSSAPFTRTASLALSPVGFEPPSRTCQCLRSRPSPQALKRGDELVRRHAVSVESNRARMQDDLDRLGLAGEHATTR